METKQATRIQTSILNAAEKKALVWLAGKQPGWMTSNYLTFIGIFGAFLIGLGYYLTKFNYNFFWLSSLGFVINWYGDSLDGTLARVRDTQRPHYGYYLDHTVDGINEAMMIIGIGLSDFVHFGLAMNILVIYLLLTLNVSVNAHLRSEFKLTYAKLGPTEFRVVCIIFNTLFALIAPLREYTNEISFGSQEFLMTAFDYVAIAVTVVLLVIYAVTVLQDLAFYAKMDPKKH